MMVPFLFHSKAWATSKCANWWSVFSRKILSLDRRQKISVCSSIYLAIFSLQPITTNEIFQLPIWENHLARYLLKRFIVFWKSASLRLYSLANILVCSRVTAMALLARPSWQLVNLRPGWYVLGFRFVLDKCYYLTTKFVTNQRGNIQNVHIFVSLTCHFFFENHHKIIYEGLIINRNFS